MMCGGVYTQTRRSCTRWSPEQGGWVTLATRLKEDRDGSVAWTGSRDRSLVILGSNRNDDAAESSETVSSDGVSTRRTFNIKYPIR